MNTSQILGITAAGLGGAAVLAIGYNYLFPSIQQPLVRRISFEGDEAYATGADMNAGNRKTIKKSKTKHKKTNRRK